MVGCVRLLSDRDSVTTSVVLVVITPPPVVKPTTATSRKPTTKESTMVPTFSRLDSEECPGVISLMPSKLYQRVDKQRSDGQTCDVAVNCLEVYNKVVRELLCLDPAKGIAILYLPILKVKEAGTLLEPLLKGKKPTQHATDANAESSWSHAIFQSYTTVTENATSTNKEIRLWVCSVDLAGSEHAAATSRDRKDQMRGGTKLNLSLLALGNCIDARSKNGTQQVRYQDSKLTHILKHSLGGSVSTLMIGTVTAVKLCHAETCNTLEYMR
ncbi:hypothetical protein HPB49_009240 [Dermacentor silvarum]|uniref:Uncharacterized protein n=1 Tax=Dermacentor silvarum TaxID=543639 RepID=A0ACB8DYE4_DERSI|nr:kinesin-like protein KIF18B [Dermacentor silvarum]KAH7979368.1 hypothetical protein HPB49_009240 [Dermacentor silvarum]